MSYIIELHSHLDHRVERKKRVRKARRARKKRRVKARKGRRGRKERVKRCVHKSSYVWASSIFDKYLGGRGRLQIGSF